MTDSIDIAAKRREAEAEQREGILAGAKLREREAAAEMVKAAEAMAAEGVDLEAAEAEGIPDRAAIAEAGEAQPPMTLPEARDILAEAERRAAKIGRNVGRWRLADDGRMSGRDLMATAKAAAAPWSRKARLSDDDRADLEAELVLGALERAEAETRRGRPADVLAWIAEAESPARRESVAAGTLPNWRDLEAAPPRKEAEQLGRQYMAAPCGSMATYEAAASRLLADASSYRAAWRNLLGARARGWTLDLLAERKERDSSVDAAEAAEQSREAVREADVAVSDLADLLSLTSREAATLASAEGVTARDRAKLSGRTPAAEQKQQQRGAADLLKRYPTPAEAAKAVAQARRAESGEIGRWTPEGCYVTTCSAEIASKVDDWRAMPRGNTAVTTRAVRAAERLADLEAAEYMARRTLAGRPLRMRAGRRPMATVGTGPLKDGRREQRAAEQRREAEQKAERTRRTLAAEAASMARAAYHRLHPADWTDERAATVGRMAAATATDRPRAATS